MLKNLFFIFFLTFSIIPKLNAAAYDDCIMKNLKGISSDVAAKAIIESCENLTMQKINIEMNNFFIFSCPWGNFFEIKLRGFSEESPIEAYIKSDKVNYLWVKQTMLEWNEEQIILKQSFLNDYYDRMRFDLITNLLTFFHSDQLSTQQTVKCKLREDYENFLLLE